MATNDNKKNIGVIIYIIISVIVIVTLSLLLIFLKKCGKDNFSSYCTSDKIPCNTNLTPGAFSCKCPGTYNGLNVLQSLQDKGGDCGGDCGGNNKIIFDQESLECKDSKLYKD